jgi:hypothetical protein
VRGAGTTCGGSAAMIHLSYLPIIQAVLLHICAQECSAAVLLEDAQHLTSQTPHPAGRGCHQLRAAPPLQSHRSSTPAATQTIRCCRSGQRWASCTARDVMTAQDRAEPTARRSAVACFTSSPAEALSLERHVVSGTHGEVLGLGRAKCCIVPAQCTMPGLCNCCHASRKSSMCRCHARSSAVRSVSAALRLLLAVKDVRCSPQAFR